MVETASFIQYNHINVLTQGYVGKKSEGLFMNKRSWSLILPIAFQQFMLSLVSASDACMLGSVSQDFLAAVSLAGQIGFVFNLFMAALVIGTSMFSAQYWGAGDKKRVEEILGFVMRDTLCLAFFFCVCAIGIPGALMKIFTDDPILIRYGMEYLRVVGISYILSGASQIYLCIMKNSGKAFFSMVISTVVVVVNIFLNAVFIYGAAGIPAMGVTGAALATVIANGISLLWCVGVSLKENNIRLQRAYLSFCMGGLERKFWKYVSPVILNELVWGVGFTMYSVIIGHLGSDAVAAVSIANIIKNLLICFCIGLGNGGSIMIGNELGAGRLTQAKRSGARLCRLSIVSGAATGILLFINIPWILHFVSLTSAASGYLKWMLVICCFNLLGRSVNGMTIAGIFCAGGDSGFGVRCDGIVMWAISIPLGLLSAFLLDLPVLVTYFLISMDEIIKLPAVYVHYKKYGWLKNLTLEEKAA